MYYDESDLIIVEYINEYNSSPFSLWFSCLDNINARKVNVGINRLKTGHLPNCKSLGRGLWEIKIDFGPGFRVYFGKRGNLIILLWGGTKHRQSNDIKRAQNYWGSYLKSGEYVTWH